MGIQFDFSGKRVLVTGSTMGIGRGAAEAFHSLGATVAINGRSAASVSTAITELGGGSRLVPAPGDLSSVSEIERVLGKLIAQLGGLDILVNNAGRGDDCLIDNRFDRRHRVGLRFLRRESSRRARRDAREQRGNCDR